MKQLLFFLLVGCTMLVVSCNKTTTVPPYSAPTIFKVNSKMIHAADTLSSAGDVILLTAQGNINDTSRLYPIYATVYATDSLLNITYSSVYLNPLTVVFDTTGLAASGLYHWTAGLALAIPAIPVKTGGKPTAIITKANFGYGLSVSSEIGNSSATDSKNIHLK